MQPRCQRQQRQVCPAAPDQRDAVRQAAGRALVGEAARHRDGRQVEQIDEVGVVAELRVQRDRIGLDGGDGVDRRRRGDDQAVDVAPGRQGGVLQFLQPVKRREGVRCGQPAARFGDCASHRVQGLGLCFDEGTDRRVTLGHPRALVQQPGDVAEGRQIDLDRHAAQRAQVLDRLCELSSPAVVAVEDQVLRPRHTEAERRRAEVAAVRRHRARIRVLRIGSLRRGQHRRRIGGRQREHRDHVERATGRDDAGGRDAPQAGLQPDQVVERSRHATRTCRVGAEGKARETQCHRNGRPRRRAAGHEGRIDRVSAGPVGRTHADQTGRELVEVGLAHRDRTRVDQPLDHRRAALRRVGEGRTGGGGRHTRQIDVVLDGERNAVQR